MKINQILESVSIGGMGTNSVATAPSKVGKMQRRQGNLFAAEDSGSVKSLQAKANEISNRIDAIVKGGGRVGLDDPLSRQLKAIRSKIQQAKKQGVAEAGKDVKDIWAADTQMLNILLNPDRKQLTDYTPEEISQLQKLAKILGRARKIIGGKFTGMSIGQVLDKLEDNSRLKQRDGGKMPDFTGRATTTADMGKQIALHTNGNYYTSQGKTWTSGRTGQRIRDANDYIKYNDKKSLDDAWAWVQSKGKQVNYRDNFNQLQTAVQIGSFIVEPNTVTRDVSGGNPDTEHGLSVRSVKSLSQWSRKREEQGVAEGSDNEELADEVYAEFERTYPNLARRADERTIHAAIIDVLNYGGDSNPSALAQDVARAVKRNMQQGVSEEKQKGVDGKACWDGYKRMGTKKKGGKTVDNCVKMEDTVEENKKGVRAVKHTTKPRNFVAKNAVATTSGAGAHKDKKKAMKQGETKHKSKEPAYESKLWAALDRRIIK